MTSLPPGARELLNELQEALATTGPPSPGVPPQRSSVPIRRFVEGAINNDELRRELEVLGYTGLRQERLVFSAILELDLATKRDVAATLARLVRDGDVPAELLQARLVEAGFQPASARVRAQLELARLPEPPGRPIAVGLVFIPEGGSELEEPDRRSIAVGLEFVGGPGSGTRDPRPRPIAVGLEFRGRPGSELERASLRPVAVGLSFVGRPGAGVADPRPRPISVGLEFEPGPGSAIEQAPLRPIAVGLEFVGGPESGVPDPRPRPIAVGLTFIPRRGETV